jgi:hypothetical protein
MEMKKELHERGRALDGLTTQPSAQTRSFDGKTEQSSQCSFRKECFTLTSSYLKWERSGQCVLTPNADGTRPFVNRESRALLDDDVHA